MDPLDRLPEVTEQALSGLQADEAMKRRILLSAANGPQKKENRFRTVVALCSLSVLLILLCAFVYNLPGKDQQTDLNIIPAGRQRNSAPVNLQKVIDEASDLVQDRTEENN